MAEEVDDDFDDSKRNQGEAAVALKHCQRLLDLGVKMIDIGIITPYAAQVGLQQSASSQSVTKSMPIAVLFVLYHFKACYAL